MSPRQSLTISSSESDSQPGNLWRSVPGDVIVLAGKGHEDYQEIRGVKYPMDERVLIAEVLEERKEEKKEENQQQGTV